MAQTCDDKHSVLDNQNNQIINLTRFDKEFKATHASGCKEYLEEYDNYSVWYRCTHYRKFHSWRERWWFIVLDNCQSTKVGQSLVSGQPCWLLTVVSQGLRMRYKITMTNNVNDRFLMHFSADEFCKSSVCLFAGRCHHNLIPMPDVLHTDVIFALLYYALFIASCFEACE